MGRLKPAPTIRPYDSASALRAALKSELNCQIRGRAVQTIAQPVGIRGLPIPGATAHTNGVRDANRDVGLRLDDKEIIGRRKSRPDRLCRQLRYRRARLRDAEADVAAARGREWGDAAQRRHIDAKRGASKAGEPAAAEPDAAELAGLPANEPAAVGHLEIALVVGEPVDGTANQQRVVEQASAVHAGELAGAIVEIGHLEVWRHHPRIIDR